MNLVITEFNSRRNPNGKVVSTTWDELKAKVKNPKITDETIEEYVAMTNEQKTEIKDVGGYVGGEFKDGKRSKENIMSRCLLTIDADDATPHDIVEFNHEHSSIEYIVHTTHTSTKNKPRLRWIFPLKRPVSADEYRALVSLVKHWVGADTIDETTDQPERLMFWPSVSFDGDFQIWEHGDTAIDPDELLRDYKAVNAEEPVKKSSVPKAGEIIGEGSRNKSMFSYGANLRGMGLDKDALRLALQNYNEEHLSPPLPNSEVETVLNSICKYEPGTRAMSMGRDIQTDFGDLGSFTNAKAKPKAEPRKLDGLSLAALVDEDIPAPKYIVEGLLPIGLALLVAPPKFGKSWMCMDLGIAVANGTEFLGCTTTQCGVMYLALEDGDYRLKSRGLMVAGNRPIPSNLWLTKDAPPLNENLLDVLDEKRLAEETRTGMKIGLIIIDTLQRIRGMASKNEGVYGHDYRELGAIQKWAMARGLCAMVVHHTNKGIDLDDPFNSISGTNGLLGAADCGLLLSKGKRKDEQARLSITGRDVVQRTLVLRMNWNIYRWENLGEEKDVAAKEDELTYNEDKLVRAIRYKLDEAEDLCDDVNEVSWACTSQEMLDETLTLFGDAPYQTPTALGRHAKTLAPDLLAKDGIAYEYRKTSTRREHVFTREVV